MHGSIFGTGYVGLVTGTCLTDIGHDVVCVDVDAVKVERILRRSIPIHEPRLEPMVKSNLWAGRLDFTTDAVFAVEHGEVIFIAVGTPREEGGSADLQYGLQVARTIGKQLERPAIIVNKSTVPVGTADRVREVIAAALSERSLDIAFEVVSNPEFLKKGAAVEDCMRPDRIVLGVSSPTAAIELKRLYAQFTRQFRTPPLERLCDALVDKVVFDGRNLYEPSELEAAGLAYYAVARGRSVSMEALGGSVG